ncbi:MAG: hypothetical protein R2751_06000 [Bacteroidales bacterium]
MNTELFIARRLIGKKKGKQDFSRSIVSIATFGIALGLAVMIVAVAIVTGFKKEISARVIGFGAHLQILNLDSNLSFETMPVPKGLDCVRAAEELEGIRHIQPYALKAGIIKTGEEIHGSVLKGVDARYDWTFIRQNLKEGRIPELSDSVRPTRW